MFFKKKPKLEAEIKLQDLVKKAANEDYVFINIHSDLGNAVQDIQASTPIVFMTYAYARRAAAAALYLQGVWNEEEYAHVVAMFKGIQQITARKDPAAKSVEFQERAFALSIEFMQSYSFLITAQFIKKVVAITNDYELSEELLSDADLFAAVTETVYQEQQALQAEDEDEDEDEEEEEEETTSYPYATVVSRSREDTTKMNEILAELNHISERNSKKTATVWVCPLKENWTFEFHYANEDEDRKEELTSQLYELMEGYVTMTHFAYKEK